MTDDVAWRVEVMRWQMPRSKTAAIPSPTARPESAPFAAGACQSCGDQLAEETAGTDTDGWAGNGSSVTQRIVDDVLRLGRTQG